MRKLKLFLTFAGVFTLTVLLLVVVASASEPDYTGSCGDTTWKLYVATGELVVSGTGEIEDLTHIQSYLCAIKSLVIEEGASSIGSGAFYGFSDLTTVTLPTSMTSIGVFAFAECTALTSITIPANVTTIGALAFSLCSSLTSITLPSSITYIGESAFEECSSLSSIIIPSGITVIEGYTFYNCHALTSVTVPASVTAIESAAFTFCPKLASVYLYSPAIVSALTSASACGDLLKYAKSVYIAENITEIPTYIKTTFPHTKTLTLGGLSYTVCEAPDVHTYGAWVEHDAEQHKRSCACGHTVYADHTHGEWVKLDAEQHKKSCVCNNTVCADHTYGEWETTKVATTKEAGVRVKTCACGNKISEEIPQLESKVGVVVAIVGGGTVAIGGGGVALYWFVFRKKKRI